MRQIVWILTELIALLCLQPQCILCLRNDQYYVLLPYQNVLNLRRNLPLKSLFALNRLEVCFQSNK